MVSEINAILIFLPKFKMPDKSHEIYNFSEALYLSFNIPISPKVAQNHSSLTVSEMIAKIKMAGPIQCHFPR